MYMYNSSTIFALLLLQSMSEFTIEVGILDEGSDDVINSVNDDGFPLFF